MALPRRAAIIVFALGGSAGIRPATALAAGDI